MEESTPLRQDHVKVKLVVLEKYRWYSSYRNVVHVVVIFCCWLVCFLLVVVAFVVCDLWTFSCFQNKFNFWLLTMASLPTAFMQHAVSGSLRNAIVIYRLVHCIGDVATMHGASWSVYESGQLHCLIGSSMLYMMLNTCENISNASVFMG